MLQFINKNVIIISVRRTKKMKGYYSIKESSEELGVSIPTIRVWVRNGTLKASKLNNGLTSKILIPKKEIKRIIAELKK